MAFYLGHISGEDEVRYFLATAAYLLHREQRRCKGCTSSWIIRVWHDGNYLRNESECLDGVPFLSLHSSAEILGLGAAIMFTMLRQISKVNIYVVDGV